MHVRHLEQLYSDSDHPTNQTDIIAPKHVALRTVVGVVCSLSMGGAILIILSYILIKSIRTKTREILVHLSVADFGAACSNFIGVTVYFDPYIRACEDDHRNSTLGFAISCASLNHLCVSQAVFAAFCTLVSVLWTLCLSVYIYTLIVHHKRGLHAGVVRFSYFFCWGMPLLITLWLVCTDRLGYSPYGGSGWCSLKLQDTPQNEIIFIVIFANDLWIYLTFIMVTVLYLTTHCYLRFQLQEANPLLLASSSRSTVHTVDKKFLLIPAAFLLLRMWSVIVGFIFVYLRLRHVRTITRVLLFAAGIGDSGQGFVNALLFCFFTPRVREKLCCCCRGNPSRQEVGFRQSLLRSNLAGRTVSS